MFAIDCAAVTDLMTTENPANIKSHCFNYMPLTSKCAKIMHLFNPTQSGAYTEQCVSSCMVLFYFFDRLSFRNTFIKIEVQVGYQIQYLLPLSQNTLAHYPTLSFSFRLVFVGKIEPQQCVHVVRVCQRGRPLEAGGDGDRVQVLRGDSGGRL